MGAAQKIRPLGLRAALLGIIALSVVLPLAASTIITRIMGYRAYRTEKGALYQTVATHYATTFNNLLDGHVRSLQEWTMLSQLPATLAAAARDAARTPLTEEELKAFDAQWLELGMNDPAVLAIVTNELSDLLRAFRSVDGRFVEILATDAEGRLIGATEMTEDFYQGDESWWQSAMQQRNRLAWVEGIHFDNSAGVYSIDVSVKVVDPDEPQAPLGIIKGVLQARQVMSSLQPLLVQGQPTSHVILNDGTVLEQLFEYTAAPSRLGVAPEALAEMQRRGLGWGVMELTEGEQSLVGFASLAGTRSFLSRQLHSGPVSMYVMSYEDLGVVLVPVHRQLRILTGVGGLLVLLFSVVGILLASRRIIEPLQLLRNAALGISATAGLSSEEGPGDRGPARPDVERNARDMIKRVDEISTGDEIQDLAEEFSLMADRVLNYHVQLQEEIRTKTEEIQRDLAMAREFQQALMPKHYPAVPADGTAAPLRLAFAHRYRPTLSVGGDFFHVTRLTETKAAVFMTDVMGHGARSALITAILRTLLHHLDPRLEEAGQIMAAINRQFGENVPHGKEFIFATALCLVVDAAEARATFASAGHPACLLVRGRPGPVRVETAFGTDATGPALGLYSDASYPATRIDLSPGDLILLYTDGLIEAPNAFDDAFGVDRVKAVAAAHAAGGAEALCDAVLAAAARHMDTVMAPDDICLAAVEAFRG